MRGGLSRASVAYESPLVALDGDELLDLGVGEVAQLRHLHARRRERLRVLALRARGEAKKLLFFPRAASGAVPAVGRVCAARRTMPMAANHSATLAACFGKLLLFPYPPMVPPYSRPRRTVSAPREGNRRLCMRGGAPTPTGCWDGPRMSVCASKNGDGPEPSCDLAVCRASSGLLRNTTSAKLLKGNRPR